MQAGKEKEVWHFIGGMMVLALISSAAAVEGAASGGFELRPAGGCRRPSVVGGGLAGAL